MVVEKAVVTGQRAFFVSGTDTGVGKTVIASALLLLAQQRGLSTFALKPIASGCESTPEGWRSSDALLLQQYSTEKLSYGQVNPVALRDAVAPHIAAQRESRLLSLERIEGTCRSALSHHADFKLVEGAGGWRVPINHNQLISGLAVQLRLPVILVVGMRLGCINHALLTAEAIRSDGLVLAAWVANGIDPNMMAVKDNVEGLQQRLSAPFLGHVPYLEEPEVPALARHLNFDQLLK